MYESNIITIFFLCFPTANKRLKDSNTYNYCQKVFSLLKLIWKAHIFYEFCKKEFSFLRNKSHSVLAYIDFFTDFFAMKCYERPFVLL